ncbi:DNA adenine methylase [Spirochaeta dissipatitropha]
MSYLQDQFIAYIGNKRSLLPFLERIIGQLDLFTGSGLPRFYDPFAGAGAVSRLAKYLGFSVHSNDWESYSAVINSTYILQDAVGIDDLFSPFGRAEEVFAELQSAGERGMPENPYISRHYAPKRTATADYRRERLFYTRENAEFVDVVRDKIEQWYPEGKIDYRQQQAKNILVSALLLEAATHANTSGVFKAFHKGFGGHGGDALSRIMSPMVLELPHLINRPESRIQHLVTCQDAAAAACGSYDLAYLDPPYNCHQYGSNYFMLNTIARWDRPAVDDSFSSDGTLTRKAGIRDDWKDTRSPYCSKNGAADALTKLLDEVDSRYLLMSYNTDGVLGFDEQLEIFSRRGKVKYFATEYTSFRGGRQSMTRRTATTEYVLMIDSSRKMKSADYMRIERQRRLQYLQSLVSQRYNPGILSENLEEESGTFFFRKDDCKLFECSLIGGFMPVTWHIEENSLSLDIVENIIERLEKSLCQDQFERFTIALDILESTGGPVSVNGLAGTERKLLEREVIKALKKFTHRKYYHQYMQAVERVQLLCNTGYEFSLLDKEVAHIREIAALRFAG